MKRINVLIVLLILVLACSKPVIVEKKFDVLSNVALINNTTNIEIEVGKDTYVVNSNGIDFPQFSVGDSLTGRFVNNQLQFVKDNKGVWLSVSKLK